MATIFCVLGRDTDLREVAALMSKWYEVKNRGMVVPDVGDLEET